MELTEIPFPLRFLPWRCTANPSVLGWSSPVAPPEWALLMQTNSWHGDTRRDFAMVREDQLRIDVIDEVLWFNYPTVI